MGLNFPTQSAIAAVLKLIPQQKKEKAMEDTLDRARQKGYDIDIELDPATGAAKYNLKYKGKSQSDMVKDKFDVAKMLTEMKKWEREEQGAQEEQQFNWLADLGFGGGAQRLSREGTSGQIKPEIKRALEMRNKFRGTGQTLLPTEKGWTRATLPKTKKEPFVYNEDEYIADLNNAISAISKGKKTGKNISQDAFKIMYEKYKRNPKKIMEIRKLLFPELFQKQTESPTDVLIKMKEAGLWQ